MPTLNWIGKQAVVNHHRQAPYHLPRCDKKLSIGDPGSGNLLTNRILGTLPAHAGPKVIYGESSRLKREGVMFKQVPYEIKVS